MIVYRQCFGGQRGHYGDSEETWEGEEEPLSCSWAFRTGLGLALVAAIVTYSFWVENSEDMVNEGCITVY